MYTASKSDLDPPVTTNPPSQLLPTSSSFTNISVSLALETVNVKLSKNADKKRKKEAKRQLLKAAKKASVKAGNSQMQLPSDSTEFTTYVDHGSILDSEGYPKYPNGNTVFVWPPDKDYTNWGTVSYTHLSRTEHAKKHRWKIWRFYCLGVLVCDQEDCDYAGSPPTGKGKIAALLNKYVCLPETLLFHL